MRGIIFDTNAYSKFIIGDNKTLTKYYDDAVTVYISTITIGEVCAGYKHGTKFEKCIKEFNYFLNREKVEILDVTHWTAIIYSDIWADLSSRGRLIPTNDIWIAANAIENRLELVTFDTHFLEVSNLKLWNELK